MRSAFPHGIFFTIGATVFGVAVIVAGVSCALPHNDPSINIYHLIAQLPLLFAAIPVFLGSILLKDDVIEIDSVRAENEHFIEQLTRTIPDILYVYDFDDRRVVYLNRQASMILGYQDWEMRDVGESRVEHLIHPDDYAKRFRWFAQCNKLLGDEVFEHQYRVRHSSGDWRWLRSREVVFKRNSSGQVSQILAVAHDITERKHIQRELIESKRRTASILKAFPDLMFVYDRNANYIDYYARDRSQLLVPPEMFLGRNIREILPPDLVGPILETFEKARVSIDAQRAEYTLNIGGTENFYEYRVVRSGDGFLAVVRNITEQKKAQRALADSERQFRDQYRGIPIATYTWDWDRAIGDFVLVDYNDEAFCASDGRVKNLVGVSVSEQFKNSPEVVEDFSRCRLKNETVVKHLSREFLFGTENKYAKATFVPVSQNLVMVHAEDVTERRIAEESLTRSELFSRSIIESSNDCIKILDLDGNLLYINARGLELLEMGDDSCLGSEWLGFWNDLDRADLRIEVAKAKAGQIGRFQGANPTARGTNKWWDVLISPIMDEKGTVERLLVVSRDITEQKFASEKLLKKEKFFRSLIENTHDIIDVLRLDGTIMYESPSVETILGYTPDERIGKNCLDYIHPDDKPRVTERFMDAVGSNSSQAVEYRYLHKSGGYVYLEVIGRVSTDEKGEPIVIVNKRDISDRKAMEAELSRSDDLYRNVVETQNELICRFRPDSTLTFVNEAYCRFFGKSRDDLVGTRFLELIPEEAHRGTEELLRKLVDDHITVFNEHEVLQPDGSIGWQQWVDSVILDPNGNVIEMQGVGRDVTEQKRFEKALLESQAKLRTSEDLYRNVVETQNEMICRYQADSTLTFVNEAYCRYFGKPREHLIGRPILDVIPYISHAQSLENLGRLFENKGDLVVERPVMRPDGTTGWTKWTNYPMRDGEGNVVEIQSVGRDVTEQKRFEKALTESEEKYRRIVDTMLEGIWVVDADMRITFANEQLAGMLGYTLEELIGQPGHNFFDDKSDSRTREIREKRVQGISEHYDARMRRKDGSHLWVLISATPIQSDSGDYLGALAMISDITERKRDEADLREAGERMRIASDAANIYTWEIEVPTAKITLSSNVERVLGFDLPADFSQITEIFHEDDRDALAADFRKSMDGELAEGFSDYRLVNPSTGEITWIRAKGTFIKETKNRPARIIGIAQNVTSSKLAEEELQQLAARLLTLQDEERRRLARELHDQTAQNLAVLDLNLASIKKLLLPEQEKASALVDQSENLTQRSLREVRTISYVLHPPSLDERGLVSAIRWMIEGFSSRSGIRVDFVQNTDIGRLPLDVETALYRVVQEGLTNIHRHAKSDSAHIELTREIDKIILVVKDEGCGFPETAFDPSGDGAQSLGVGVRGMRERLRLLGGWLDVNSSESGTTLTGIVPIAAE